MHKLKHKSLCNLTIDKHGLICYNNYRKKEREVNKMFVVDTRMDNKEFETYREAEIFCGENGIHPENIFEEN
jgi:hypothetical protein